MRLPQSAPQFRGFGEFAYQPGQCTRPYRVVALRENISKLKGENRLFDEIRYFFSITTRTDLSAAAVVACANERCDQENVIKQLKNGVNALRLPAYDLVSNWTYMVMAALAWNIKAWFAMMAPEAGSRHLHSDGVSAVHERPYSDLLSGGATGQKYCHTDPGLSADAGSAL